MKLFDKVNLFSIEKDIVRPDYDVNFRIGSNREVFGWGEEDDYASLCCIAYCNEIPTTMKELEDDTSIISPYKSHIAVAYTIWNNSDTVKGAGRSLIFALQEHFSFDRDIMRLITLSPLTEMAKKFHLSNGAKLLQTNSESYNFEYKISN
tara:strand:- start:319 stop:768 length:450 start_codon:yes stop_codon:yes gene_type:complete